MNGILGTCQTQLTLSQEKSSLLFKTLVELNQIGISNYLPILKYLKINIIFFFNFLLYFFFNLQIDVEPWADPGEPTEDEAFEKAILDRKIFEIHPK